MWKYIEGYLKFCLNVLRRDILSSGWFQVSLTMWTLFVGKSLLGNFHAIAWLFSFFPISGGKSWAIFLLGSLFVFSIYFIDVIRRRHEAMINMHGKRILEITEKFDSDMKQWQT